MRSFAIAIVILFVNRVSIEPRSHCSLFYPFFSSCVLAGLVYRGSYLVNWSPHLQTAVSDLEVDHAEEAGTLYHFKYVLHREEGGEGRDSGGEGAEYIPVATTRPETIPGDSAVCVHPEDPRYQRFIGRQVKVPISGRLIPGKSSYIPVCLFSITPSVSNT